MTLKQKFVRVVKRKNLKWTLELQTETVSKYLTAVVTVMLVISQRIFPFSQYFYCGKEQTAGVLYTADKSGWFVFLTK
jgi:hypothetical protein